MPIYEMTKESIVPIPQTTFAALDIRERSGMQRLLRECIDVIAPGIMVIAEEFGDWEDSNRRIDLLGLDKSGSLVVIELKRTEDGGHMELQSIRYAAMISTMTFEQAVEAHRKYLDSRNLDSSNPSGAILRFLGVDGPLDFNASVRIVLASAEFSKEITSSVLWLNDRNVDITCVRLRPHRYGDKILLDVQQVIPLPEAAEFQIAIQQKANERRAVERAGRDFTKYDLTVRGQVIPKLNKRKFVLQVVKEAVLQGMTPETISDLVPSRSTWLFIARPGQLNHDQFVEAATDESLERYFIDDEDLFHVAGKTYALTNQWGRQTEDTVRTILAKLPDATGIAYEALPSL